MTVSKLKIRCKPFTELSTTEWHDIVKLRVDVFVVEQACAYPELDGRDLEAGTIHAMAIRNGELVGYARAVSPEPSTNTWRIGRVVVDLRNRRTGVARELILQLMHEGQNNWPNQAIEISAQSEVVAFYRSLGFLERSDEYLEDGIAHIDMRQAGGDN